MRGMLLVVTLAASVGCLKKGNVTRPCAVIDLHADRVAKLYAEREAPTTRGSVYWSRRYLEEARWILTAEEGYRGATPCTSGDRKYKQYKKLKDRFEEAEERVRYMEEQRGVKFHSVPGGNSLRWVYVKDGSVVPNDVANSL